MTSHLIHHFPGCGSAFAFASVRLPSVALAVSLALVGCTASSNGDPEAAGYFPHYGRGIDQDVAIGRDSGVPVGSNLYSHIVQPLRFNR